MNILIMYKHLFLTLALGVVVTLAACNSGQPMVENGMGSPSETASVIKLEPHHPITIDGVEIELEEIGPASVQDPTLEANLYVMEPENTWGDYLKKGEKLEIYESLIFEVTDVSRDPVFAVLTRL